jgi:hypothetical protein
MSFTNHLFSRDVSWPTNYAGYIEFDDDGHPATFHPFALWVLSLNDTNDANGNGIPDFSDDPQPSAPPRRPQLSLARGPSYLFLTISGDTNHVHQVQDSLVLPATNWQNVVSFTLISDLQTVLLHASHKEILAGAGAVAQARLGDPTPFPSTTDASDPRASAMGNSPLSSIAKAKGTTASLLKAANVSGDRIVAGRKLKLPGCSIGQGAQPRRLQQCPDE